MGDELCNRISKKAKEISLGSAILRYELLTALILETYVGKWSSLQLTVNSSDLLAILQWIRLIVQLVLSHGA